MRVFVTPKLFGVHILNFCTAKYFLILVKKQYVNRMVIYLAVLVNYHRWCTKNHRLCKQFIWNRLLVYETVKFSWYIKRSKKQTTPIYYFASLVISNITNTVRACLRISIVYGLSDREFRFTMIEPIFSQVGFN